VAFSEESNFTGQQICFAWGAGESTAENAKNAKTLVSAFFAFSAVIFTVVLAGARCTRRVGFPQS
jgi:hypothetical protein